MKTIAQLFKALSEEIRLRILGLLSRGELCVCDLMAVLDLPQSTISRHLSYLANAGWLIGQRRGVWMYYRINEKNGDIYLALMPILLEYLAECPAFLYDQQMLETYLRNKKKSACD